MVAATALVALLAAGFGVLGGRPQPSLLAAEGSSPSPARSTLAARTPAATPDGPCGPLPPDGPPGVMLTVGNHLMAGRVEFADGDPGPPQADREPIDVPVDGVAQLRIAAGACATGWHIAVWSPSDGQLYPVAIVPNPDEDPGVAQANRFDVVMTPFRDLPADVMELRANLQLPGRDILARWPIRLLPFVRPRPSLLLPNAATTVAGPVPEIPLVEGCDVVLTFANGFEERESFCPADLKADPGPALKLPPGIEMTLDFDGWSIGDTIGYCGATSDLAFLVMSPPSCEQHPPHGRSFVTPQPGDWTMAIAACAIKAGNRICGTWYANVDTR